MTEPNNLPACAYYTINGYNSLLEESTTPSSLRLLNINIRSFNANQDKLEALLNSLSRPPSVLVLTESWNTDDRVKLCKLNSYSDFHSFRPNNGRGGGVSIFCTNVFNSVKIESLSFVKDPIETCCSKIYINQNDYIIVLAIYRPPNESIPEFLTELEIILKNSILTSALHILLAGDVNLNLLDQESVAVNNFSAFMHSLFFVPTITIATRFPNIENVMPTNLDPIWISRCLSFTSGVLDFDISDHLPTFVHFDLPSATLKTNEKIKVFLRPYSQENFDLLSSKVLSFDWQEIYQGGDPNISIQKFMSSLNSLYCSCFPLKIKYLSKKRIQKPWITQDLMHLIRRKSEYFYQYRIGLISQSTNNRYRNKINKEIDKAKNKYYENIFKFFVSDSKKMWKTIKTLIGTSNDAQSIKELIVNGTRFTEESVIPDQFNKFFSEIAIHLENQLPPSNISPLSFMPPRSNRSFYLFQITENECIKCISKLKVCKTKIDEMPIKIFKSLKSYLAPILTRLINLCFSRGVFPDCLKIGRLTPIFKSGDKTNPSNYRPITSLPYISKIFEHLLRDRLVKYFNKFSLFTHHQFGIREDISTSDAIISLTNQI